MKRIIFLFMTLIFTGSLSLAALAGGSAKTFVGSIRDSMCGAKHMMPGKSDKDCTLECVKGGSKYVLVDSKGKVYQLTDQKKPQSFAGAKAKITGTLTGDTIAVTSIEAAK